MVSLENGLREICVLIDSEIFPRLRNYDTHQEAALLAKIKELELKITALNGLYGHFDNLPITDDFAVDLALLKVFSGIFDTLEAGNRKFDGDFIDKFVNIEGFSVKYELIKNASPAYALYYIEGLFSFTDLNVGNENNLFDYIAIQKTTHLYSNSKAEILSSDRDLILVIEKIMLCPIVKKLYVDYIPINLDYEGEVKLALTKCYMFRLPEKHYAKTLSNLHIVIDSFSTIRNLTLKYGVTFICFAHEFAHYIQRRNLSTRQEVLGFSTPKQGKKKSEAGFSIETKLFGKQIDYLTIGGAQYLLNGEFPTIKVFKKRFKIKNRRVEGQEIAKLNRKNTCSQEYVELGTCSMYLNKKITENFRRLNEKMAKKNDG